MSKENVRLFYEEIFKNETLQERLKSIGSDLKGQKPDEAQMELIYQNEVLPVAKEYGFEFTIAEVKEYVTETNKVKIEALSDDELEAVSGGLLGCICGIAGGGFNNNHTESDVACVCALAGGGSGKSGDVCACVFLGLG